MNKENFRDFLALGSWVFFLLVIARALIQPYRPFVDQMIIAGIILVLIAFIWNKDNWAGYVARGFVIIVFTTIFYGDAFFTGFAWLVFIGLIYSSLKVGRKWKEIGYGFIVGIISSGVAWYLSGFSNLL